MFRGFTRNLRSNIAQIAICFVLFPTVMTICYIFSSSTAGSESLSKLLSMFSDVPVCGVAFDLLSQYVAVGAEVKISEISVLLFLKAFPETIMVSVLVHFFVQLFQRDYNSINTTSTGNQIVAPLPILPTFLGLVVSTVLVGLLNLSGNAMITFIAELFLIAIIIFGIKLMFGKKFTNGIFSLKKILTLIIDGLYAVIFSTYVASMVVVGSGTIQRFKEAFAFEMTMIGAVLVATALFHYIRKACKGLV